MEASVSVHSLSAFDFLDGEDDVVSLLARPFSRIRLCSGFFSHRDAFQECGILHVTDQVLVFWPSFSKHLTVLYRLINDGVNRTTTRIEFATDVTGPNSSISFDHFIKGGNGIVGVCC
ncbi:hypothetical protein TNIN_147091 [Trichonephila inaurata madagascariensis]|uniref:Uncharacterized protein n=1 Tax=Trichonephila inaurata madagascariensis TaxID=2747483 RepID=A0A8X6WNZ3_9ARAC|nr:hypothetical protein TNIN_147091 [Trichonephila inaurata madagascariensis]